MIKRTSVFILFLASALMLNAQAASYSQDIYSAFVNNKMPEWKSIIDRLENDELTKSGSIMELINYQYGYIGWCLGNEMEDEADTYLDLAWENLEELEERGYMPSMVNAYKSAFYGFGIGLSSWRAPFLGPKSLSSAELSLEQDSMNHFGYLQKGNSLYYMPRVFGGSKTRAIELYVKAQTLMESDSSAITGDWNYLSLLITIAQAYTDIEDYGRAKAYYEKILGIEPAFQWVRDELYPALLKQM